MKGFGFNLILLYQGISPRYEHRINERNIILSFRSAEETILDSRNINCGLPHRIYLSFCLGKAVHIKKKQKNKKLFVVKDKRSIKDNSFAENPDTSLLIGVENNRPSD